MTENQEQQVEENTQEAEQATEELNQATEAIEEGLTEETKETSQEKNWKAIRDKQERLEREYEKERQKREEYEQLLYKQLTKPKEELKEDDEIESIADDDWLTKKQSQKLAQKLATEAVKKALEEDRRQRSEQELPYRLKNQYPDFENVVTEDNVKQLRAQEPELAQALSQIHDKQAQAIAAYKYIKSFIPKAAEQTDYKERVEKNSKKPGSLSAVGSSSLSQATGFEKGLTPELRKQLWQEMNECSKKS